MLSSKMSSYNQDNAYKENPLNGQIFKIILKSGKMKESVK